MNKIIYLLLTVCFFTSCETSDDVPFLSIPDEDAQIIEMSVDVESSANLLFTPTIYASQMILDWGDGSLPSEYVNADTIDFGTSLLKPLKYAYATTGNYDVNIRAVKVTRLTISLDSARQHINKLQMTDCRHLKALACVNQTLKSVNIARSGLKTLEFNTLSLLEDFSVSACDSLFSIVLSQNPLLNTINLSDNPQMSALSLNALFRQLPPAPSDTSKITLSNNQGDATCDKSIATQKGWAVNIE